MRVARKPRKLNIPLIKGVVMCVLSVFMALGSAITGIGPQIAATPTVEFMLGYSPSKSAATALVFALVASSSAAATAIATGTSLHWQAALALAVGATVGVILTAGIAARPAMYRAKLLAQTLVIVLMTTVMSATLRGGILGPAPLTAAWARETSGVFLLGLLCGGLSTTLQIATGVLIVPALVFLAARATAEAIAISLVVVAIASVLPALAHVSAGRVDARMAGWMSLGGAIGGSTGGALMSHLTRATSPVPLVAFALVGMFLSAWTLSRSNGPPAGADGYNEEHEDRP